MVLGRTGRVMRGVKREDKNVPPPRVPISPGIVIPNHSGDHTAGTTRTPVNDLDIANKKYVDDNALGSLTSAHILVGNSSNVATDVAMSGDIAITNTGATSFNGAVIVDADINASASISFSKLAALNSAQLLVGNASNVATSVAITGDVSITNAGVTTVTDLTITSEASGDILYFNGSNWVRLAKGSDTEVLTLASGVPSWAAASGSGNFTTGTYTGDGTTSMGVTGVGFQPKVVMVCPKYTASTLTNFYIACDQMNSALCYKIHSNSGTGNYTLANKIISLDADGFTVDDAGSDIDPNKNNEVYVYIAWG